MKKYRIIASDLDGTLLNNDGKISRENIDVITTLRSRGIEFVPCTGRTYSEIPENIINIPGIRYFIYSNGAVVFDRESGNHILNCIDKNTAKIVWDIVSSSETHITFRHNGQCFVDSRFQDNESFEYYNVIVPHQIVVRDFSVFLYDFKKVSYELDNIEVFSVFFHNYEDKVRCRKLLENTNKLKTVEASEFNLEIMSIDAGKGRALYSLADMLGVAYDETIGVGDSDNDNTLISAAGLGLATSNACKSLKEIADEIICSNEEHIAEYILKHYLL